MIETIVDVPALVRGFRFSGVSAGIKAGGRPDLALAVAERDATAAAVFTTNIVRAAPVTVAAERVATGRARAVLVNSGCANACTGRAGLDATLASTRSVAELLGVDGERVVPASTGVIGAVLPAAKIANAARPLVDALRADGATDFARAIMTTDRGPKIAHARGEIGGKPFTVLGLAKGAGMFHPALAPLSPPHATMLTFLFTDLAISREALAATLERAADATFNSATVDGDTSTNDTVLALASGDEGAARIDGASPAIVADAFHGVCDALARMMVADGEGAEHLVEIRVRGLATDADARVVARTIATSPLVKTALFGRDPNWGRILGAAGRAGPRFDPELARIAVGGFAIVAGGVAIGAEAEARAKEVMQRETYAIDVELGDGPGQATYLACDLGMGYIRCNADYRS